MAEQRLGVIMNGVTGRMGTNQHLARSVMAIRKEGGVRLGDGTREIPDPLLVPRNAAKLKNLAAQHGAERGPAAEVSRTCCASGGTRWGGCRGEGGGLRAGVRGGLRSAGVRAGAGSGRAQTMPRGRRAGVRAAWWRFSRVRGACACVARIWWR